jgi:hypothetical protein
MPLRRRRDDSDETEERGDEPALGSYSLTRRALSEMAVPASLSRTTKSTARWPTLLLAIEPRLRRLRGYRALPQLRVALQQVIAQGKEVLVA